MCPRRTVHMTTKVALPGFDLDEGSYFPLVSGDHLLLVHITYGAEAPERATPHIDAANLDGSDRHTLVGVLPPTSV